MFKLLVPMNQMKQFKIDYNYEKIAFDLIDANWAEKVDIYEKRVVHSMKSGDDYDYENYHNLNEINNELKRVSKVFANITRLFSLGQTYEKREIYAIRIAKDYNKKIIVFECGIHAREWISPAVCLYSIKHLLNEQTLLINKYQFLIIPTINPDGYDYTWTGDRFWRKNRQQISEKDCFALETKALSNYLKQIGHKLVAYFAFHSYGQLWTYPYSYTKDKPCIDDHILFKQLSEIATNAIKRTHNKIYTYGDNSDLLYMASGVSNDWVYATFGVKINFGIELRDQGQFNYFLPAPQIKPTSEEMWAAIEAIFKHVSQTDSFATGSTLDDIRKSVDPYVALKDNEERAQYEDFWKLNSYFHGNTDKASDYGAVEEHLKKLETGKGAANRLFYLALPPTVYAATASALHSALMSQTGWNRLIIEKPFGRDSESSNTLSEELSKLFTEDQIYRIDHYLGKEMVQNLLSLRFANRIYEQNWNKDSISNVEILFKEPFGTQ
ncbi:unnamed protein product, partial [Oppiella nova]